MSTLEFNKEICPCRIDEFLELTKNALDKKHYKKITLVLGNESCDLDSAVCAIVYATYLHWQHQKLVLDACTSYMRKEDDPIDEIYVPILNVPREDYNIKTEVEILFNQLGIYRERLVFRNDYNFMIIASKGCNVVLVDHHVLARDDEFLAPHVIEIIDHRPVTVPSWDYKPELRTHIEQVGSCATNVCERIKDLCIVLGKEQDFFELYPDCNLLLYSAIILDTVNFSKEVAKGTKKDEQMVKFLEGFIKPGDVEEYRREKLKFLQEAKVNVQMLTSEQLLRKDLKIDRNFYIPSFPILVEAVLLRENMEEAIAQALKKQKCNIGLFLGMVVEEDELKRDFAVLWTKAGQAEADKFIKFLKEFKDPSFNILQGPKPEMPNCKYFKQLNKLPTRKQFIIAVHRFREFVIEEEEKKKQEEINRLREQEMFDNDERADLPQDDTPAVDTNTN